MLENDLGTIFYLNGLKNAISLLQTAKYACNEIFISNKKFDSLLLTRPLKGLLLENKKNEKPKRYLYFWKM